MKGIGIKTKENNLQSIVCISHPNRKIYLIFSTNEIGSFFSLVHIIGEAYT